MLHWITRFWARLPLRLLHAVGAIVGVAVYLLSPGYRKKFNVQAQAAGLSAAQKRAAIAHSGRWAAETPWVWLRPISEVAELVQSDDWPIAEAAIAKGNGLVLLTPHLGCYEAAGRAFAARGLLTVLYKAPKQAWLAEMLAAQRATTQLATASATRQGVMQLLRALKAGGTLGILPDQVPGLDQGEWATFFGLPAYTMSLPGRLVHVTGAAVVIGVCVRLPKGAGWRLHLRPMSAPITSQTVNDAMQQLILEFPEQYIWGYNRFRQPR
jgi:Kdo2-lipid IVA lauroyltransferase/acyltransferase